MNNDPTSRRATRVHGAASALFIGLLVLSSFARADDPPILGEFVRTWGGEGDQDGQFYFPIGVALDPHGDVLVTDHYNSRVQRFSADGQWSASYPVLPNPGGIAVAPDGTLYLSHFSASRVREERTPDRVSVYSPQGELLREWGSSGTEPGQFDFPGGMALDAQGLVYVADQTNRRVQVFTPQGEFLRQWGEYGLETGQFGGNTSAKSRVGGPNFLAFDADGALYTTEASVGRIQKFTPDGEFLLAWGDNTENPGGFGGKFAALDINLIGPIGISCDPWNRLWVSAVAGRIQCFSTTGQHLGGLAWAQGTEPGQVLAPHGIACSPDGSLYVVDSYNHRVQQFRLAPPPEAEESPASSE